MKILLLSALVALLPFSTDSQWVSYGPSMRTRVGGGGMSIIGGNGMNRVSNMNSMNRFGNSNSGNSMSSMNNMNHMNHNNMNHMNSFPSPTYTFDGYGNIRESFDRLLGRNNYYSNDYNDYGTHEMTVPRYSKSYQNIKLYHVLILPPIVFHS